RPRRTPPTAGAPVPYTTPFRSSGDGVAHDVTIDDNPLPATGFLWAVDTTTGATTASNCAVTGTATTTQSLHCGNDELAKGESVKDHITSATDTTTTGTLYTTAS